MPRMTSATRPAAPQLHGSRDDRAAAVGGCRVRDQRRAASPMAMARNGARNAPK